MRALRQRIGTTEKGSRARCASRFADGLPRNGKWVAIRVVNGKTWKKAPMPPEQKHTKPLKGGNTMIEMSEKPGELFKALKAVQASIDGVARMPRTCISRAATPRWRPL